MTLPPPHRPKATLATALEPRSLGEVISDGVLLLRRHLKTVVLAMLPFCAIELILREAGSTLVGRARTLVTALGTGADVELASFTEAGLNLASAVGLLMAGMAVIVVLVAVATAHTAAVVRGEDPSAGEVVRTGLRYSLRVLIAELIFDLTLIALTVLPFTLVGFAAVFLDSVVLTGLMFLGATVVWLALVLTVYLRWVLAQQLIVLEDLGPIAALIRSAELMAPEGVRVLRGPKVKLSVILLIYWGVASVVQSTFLLPVAIFGLLDGVPVEEMPPPLSDVALWLALPVAFAQVFINSVLYPMKATLPTLFYFDLRARYDEGAPEDGDAIDVESDRVGDEAAV